MKKYSYIILSGLMALFAASIGCSDDDSDINHQPNWIGAPCTCEGSGCEIMGIPVPAPTADAKIIGCENVDGAGIEGGKVVCLRTIPADLHDFSPTVYAPKGYCSVSAVRAEMENDTFASMANYGDPTKMDACPKGSAMITSVFDYSIVETPAKIANKTCVKLCNTDADCNTDGEMKCLNKKGVRFCYNEENLKIDPDYTIEPF